MAQQQSGQTAGAQRKDDAPTRLRLAPQLLIMVRVLLASPERTKILLLAAALVAVIGATASSGTSRHPAAE
jgi:hypothetical protein